jgi:hypothetical protein
MRYSDKLTKSEFIYFLLKIEAEVRMVRYSPPIQLGAVLMALAIIALLGWRFLNWTFVDPFFSTLVFFSGPFFIGMGFANPNPERVRERTRVRT